MFLRSKTRKKDGKEHRYWSVVENRRVADGRVVCVFHAKVDTDSTASWTPIPGQAGRLK